jgi:hypothetical protein
MRQNKGLHNLDIMFKIQVALISIFARSLKQTAIEQETRAVDFDEMLAAGDSLRRAVEGDFHDKVSSCSSVS